MQFKKGAVILSIKDENCAHYSHFNSPNNLKTATRTEDYSTFEHIARTAADIVI